MLLPPRGLSFFAMTEVASATAPVTAPVAVFATLRTTRLATDGVLLSVVLGRIVGLAVADRAATALVPADLLDAGLPAADLLDAGLVDADLLDADLVVADLAG